MSARKQQTVVKVIDPDLRDSSRQRADWRWIHGNLLAKGGLADRADIEPIVRRIAAYTSARAESPDQAQATDPELAAAEALQRDAHQTAMLKVLVVAGTPPSEIVQLTNLQPQLLQVWEDIFFDVRRRSDAQSWITHYVIGAEIEAGNRQLAERLQMAAGGGPVVARLLLREEAGVCVEADEGIVLQQLRLQLKLKRALEIPVRTPTQALNFVHATIALQKITNEFRLEQERLAFQERQAQRAHEQEVLRLKTKLASIQTHVLCTSVPVPATAGIVPVPAAANSEILVSPTLPCQDSSPAEFPAGTKTALHRTDESSDATGAAHPLDRKSDEPIVFTFPANSSPVGDPHVVLATAWSNGSIRSLPASQPLAPPSSNSRRKSA